MRAASMPRMSFPDRDEVDTCSHWCAPLHMVERVVAGLAGGRYFDVDHFMIAGKLHRRSRPAIYLYKHSFTRCYLNLDEAGHSYSYHPPRGEIGYGQYRRDRKPADAIARLRLHEMTHLFGSPFIDEEAIRRPVTAEGRPGAAEPGGTVVTDDAPVARRPNQRPGSRGDERR